MGKFEVFKGTKEWHFNLKAGNGEIIAASEGYKTKAGCLKGVASVQKNAIKAMIEIRDGKKKREVQHKTLVKELIKEDKIKADPKVENVIKPPEEVEDEKRTLPRPRKGIPLPGQIKGAWL